MEPNYLFNNDYCTISSSTDGWEDFVGDWVGRAVGAVVVGRGVCTWLGSSVVGLCVVSVIESVIHSPSSMPSCFVSPAKKGIFFTPRTRYLSQWDYFH